jgi:hypothetical protein
MTATLLCNSQSIPVSRISLVANCLSFFRNPLAAFLPYHVQPTCSPAHFLQFVSAIEGAAIDVSAANGPVLVRLSDEFGFDTLRELVTKSLPDVYFARSPKKFGSSILPELPEILSEFSSSRFHLLWRGTRDGFASERFHRRCDGHPNTLTIVRDTCQNIFGGFTPVPWENDGGGKADDSRYSFLFTIKNPHNVPPRKFRLRDDTAVFAIVCRPHWGPVFSGVKIVSDCNTKDNDAGGLGNTYANDTGLDGTTFLTGKPNFRVVEIEVFEIL